MRRAAGLGAVLLAAVSLWNCRPGNPLSQVPRVGPTPEGLAERFQRPLTWEWGKFQSPDDAMLRIGSAKPIGGATKGTVVILGGYMEFGEKYYETYRDLLALGYGVATLDWRGQGGSQRYLANPRMAHSLGFEHDAADLASYLQKTTTQPVYLLAHSMGGNIALRVMHDHPKLVRAAVLSAPAFRIGSRAGMPAWQARTLAGLMVAAGFGQSYALGQHDWQYDPQRNAANSPVSHDPERDPIGPFWFRARPELKVGGGTYRWAYEFYRSCAEIMDPAYLQAISTPILIGSAGQDTFVDAAAHPEACAQLRACRVVRYPEARHELLAESDSIRGPFLEEIERFLAAH